MLMIYKKIKRKIEYLSNSRHAYDYESERSGWKKNKRYVWGGASMGSMFDPYIVEECGCYRMYVSERKTDSIITVFSKTGLYWEQKEVSLNPGESGTWEEKVNRACVCKRGSIWYMWYTGQNANSSKIGVAISQDGIHFDKVHDNPVLIPQYVYEGGAVMNPCVMWDDDMQIFRMWYAAGDQFEPDVICYATSQDGIVWEKYAQNPIFTKSENKYDQCKVGGCHVVKNIDETYLLFYIGYQNIDTARICVAKSSDGISNWHRAEENPILSPQKNNWDSDAVYKPSVLYDDKAQIWRLWYNGRKKNCECIGYAEKREWEIK